MKPYLSYSLILAAAASGMAFGAATAYTTPVGYVSITVPANADTTVTPPLERATVLAAASSSIAGNVIGASGLTPNAYVTTQCYLVATSGPLLGKSYQVTANDAVSITVNGGATTLQVQGFVSGNTYKVVPYWTLNTLFPGGAGVGTTADAFNPTAFVFASSTGFGTNKASAVAYFYCTGDVGNGVVAGWYDANDPFSAPLDNTKIDLSRMYSIRNPSVTVNSVVVSGQVPNTGTVIPVAVNTAFNDVYLGAPYPIDVSLPNSGLQSAIQGSPDAFNPVEVVFVYNDLGAGFNKAAAVGYFYCTGDVGNGVVAGWYDANDPFTPPLTGNVIKAGRCLVIRKAPYGSAGFVPWTAPIPYTL